MEWKDTLLQNLDKGVLTNIKIHPSDVQREDCNEKCGEKSCMFMYEQQKNLNACKSCHLNPKKCFRPSISGGNCEDCLEDESQIVCSDTRNFGCTNPDDIYSYDGVDPYFMIKTTLSQASGIKQECVFCNQSDSLIG